MTDVEVPQDVQDRLMEIFDELGLYDPDVEGIEIRFYSIYGAMDRIYSDGESIRYTLAARPEYDGESDERDDT